MQDMLSMEERFKKLKTMKRKNLDKLKRIKRSYVKAKMEKKRINKEVKELQREWAEKVKANPEMAKERFSEMVKSVTNDDIFPRDLEEEFNKIEHEHMMGKKRNMKVEDMCEDGSLNVPINVAEVFQRELDADLDDEPKAVDSEEVDEETKEQLVDAEDVGLTDSDLFIDEEGNERTEEEK